ncbi:hypothetical protein YPPY19_2990, partial [Yersinia pestis PY-19]
MFNHRPLAIIGWGSY